MSPKIVSEWFRGLLLPGLGVVIAGGGLLAWAGGWGVSWPVWAVVLGLGGATGGLLVLAARRQRRIAALEERVRELGALSSSREAALAGAGIGIWEYDSGRNSLAGDRRMQEIFGFGPEEARQDSEAWRARLHPDDAAGVVSRLCKAVEAGQYRDGFRIMLPGGEIRHVRLSGSRHVEADGSTRIVGICREVTEEVAQEQTLRAKLEEAASAQVAEARRLAMMGLETRVTARGITDMLDLLRAGMPDPEQRRQVEIARAWTEALREISEAVVARDGEAERLPPVQVPVHVGRLVEEVAARYRPVGEAMAAPVVVEIAPRVPDRVIADPVRLRQIVVTLLGRALGHTGLKRIEIGIGYVRRTAELSITVQAFGSGIEADAAADGGKARLERLAAQMGGTVAVEHERGRERLVVTVTAPRAGGEADAPGAGVGPLAVLLAEDNATNQMVVAAMLKRAGHRVTIVANGREAVEAVRDGNFDVILMDVEMPVMDGREAVRAIRELDGPAADVPVVALTAHAMEGDRERYLDLGMSDYLAKPIEPKALAAVLARASATQG